MAMASFGGWGGPIEYLIFRGIDRSCAIFHMYTASYIPASLSRVSALVG